MHPLTKSCRESGYLLSLRGAQSPLLGAIRVTGVDAASFLNSQLTNEVKALKPGEGNLPPKLEEFRANPAAQGRPKFHNADGLKANTAFAGPLS